MQVDVEFYTMANGRKPAKEFLDELAPKMRAKMVRIIQLLETRMGRTCECHTRSIWEMDSMS